MKAFLIIVGISILIDIVIAIIDTIHKSKHEKFINEHTKDIFKK
jgi:hypothetical protein